MLYMFCRHSMSSKDLILTNLDVCLKWFDEWRTTHCLCFHNMIVEQQLDIVHSRKDRNTLSNIEQHVS